GRSIPCWTQPESPTDANESHCHPERSEGSRAPAIHDCPSGEILRFAQDEKGTSARVPATLVSVDVGSRLLGFGDRAVGVLVTSDVGRDRGQDALHVTGA